MSQDLLAEFGFSEPSQTRKSQSATSGNGQHRYSFFDDLASLNPTSGDANSQRGSTTSEVLGPGNILTTQAQTRGYGATQQDVVLVDEDNDDWGDFEAAEAGNTRAGIPAVLENEATSWNDSGPTMSTGEPSSKTRCSNTPTITQGQCFTRGSQPPPFREPPAARNLDILFDAEDFNEGNDFGDFETEDATLTTDPVAAPEDITDHCIQTLEIANSRKSPSQPLPSVVLSVSGSSANLAEPTLPVSTSKPRRLNLTSALQPTQPAERADGDVWEDFSESLPVEATTLSTTSDENALPAESVIPSLPSILSNQTGLTTDELPPTNIPPPAVLLSLFPNLLQLARTQLFQPMAAQPYTTRNRILSSDTTISFLRGYLALATVVGRIIAGRKLRWKRDSYLSQGMRIGPASSGRSTGMKLTGIDRAENSKEEREVLDVVRIWKEQLGRLRSAVAGANNASSNSTTITPLGPIPEIRETVLVSTVKETEGGLSARHQCALCGLKREERVKGVDADVQDSFGEWWVEQVSMHLTCRNFWTEHRAALRQR
ncbi:hypothetical protein BJ546DRAFT_856431 [Cryomyces antarcticus]